MTTEEELFQCAGCGQAFTPEAPDLEHTVPKKKKEKAKDPIPVAYVCKDCGETNTIYWGVTVEEPLVD